MGVNVLGVNVLGADNVRITLPSEEVVFGRLRYKPGIIDLDTTNFENEGFDDGVRQFYGIATVEGVPSLVVGDMVQFDIDYSQNTFMRMYARVMRITPTWEVSLAGLLTGYTTFEWRSCGEPDKRSPIRQMIDELTGVVR